MRAPKATSAVVCIAFITTPAMAQDHSAHEGMDHGRHAPIEEQQSEHTQSNEMQMDHSQMDHSQMDHSQMDHSQMDHSQMDHSQMDHSQTDIPAGPPPPRAFEGPKHAAELYFPPAVMARARAYSRATHGDMKTGVLLAERLEARLAEGEDSYVWDVNGWYGTATDKLVIKTEGEGEFSGGIEEAEIQALWGHAIGPFIDLQFGSRLDVEPETRAYLVIGAAGLAPYMIHFDASLFLSDRGDLTARLEAEHDVRLTQRLILQPRLEAELSAQDIPEREVGAGFSEVAIGARLRYEFVPEFAPYLGVEYGAATGRTADYIRARGGDPDGISLLAGVRFWF